MITCLQPVRFFNKYTQSYMSAPCGKCAACLSLKQLQWKQRLEFESLCHKYTYFITLTYCNEFLPAIFIDSQSEIYSSLDKASYYLCEVYEWHVPVLQKRDTQLFIKRLRKIFREEYGAELRYYLIGEYGSTTKRPHYHMLLWFSSDEVQQCIEVLISRAWQSENESGDTSSIGRTDCQLVASSAAQYVSTYTTGTSLLPNIYELVNARPFHTQSQSPSIGSGVIDRKIVQEIVNNGYIDADLSEISYGKISTVPFWKALENTIYPKCYEFNKFSEFGLRFMYELYLRFQKRDLKEVLDLVASCCQDKTDGMSFRHWSTSHISDSGLVFALNFIFVYFVDEEKDCFIFNFSRFVRSYYLSIRVEHFIDFYDLNREIWFLSLLHYYSAKELRSLRHQLEFQEKCFLEHHPHCYPYIVDSCFYDNANRLPIGVKNIYLRQFKVVDEVEAIKDDYFLRSKELLYTKIFNDGVKSKVKNDYLSAHPEFNKLYR